jgi:2-methylcitrate dehydratase PrpD
MPIVDSPSDMEADISQIEAALRRIECPHVRYWIAQFVDLLADGVAAADSRATTLAAKHAAGRSTKQIARISGTKKSVSDSEAA